MRVFGRHVVIAKRVKIAKPYYKPLPYGTIPYGAVAIRSHCIQNHCMQPEQQRNHVGRFLGLPYYISTTTDGSEQI